MRVAPPSKDRLTQLALRALEEALAEAERGPVKRHFGHRLALAWLAHCGIGLDWHYAKFWNAMADAHPRENDTFKHYLRSRNLSGLLDHWYLSLGWERPCPVQRAAWAGWRPSAPTIKVGRKMMTVGWKLNRDQREELLERFPPLWPDVIADHVTLSVSQQELPPAVSAQIVGQTDDGAGLQALVVAIDGSTDRADGSTFHITWSLDRFGGRVPVESNHLLAKKGWTAIDVPIPIDLVPANLA
jgi:hypothetical protein